MKSRILTIVAYSVIVAVVLLMSQCEDKVTLTTVKKDARHIIELAAQVESEEELKHVEKLARQYEIGYQRMYNNAKSLEFKRLTNDALREASAICDAIHAEEERINGMQNAFHGSLNDLDAAWSHTLSLDADIAKIESNMRERSEIEGKIAQTNRAIEELAVKLIDAGYPQDMLAELGELKEQVVEYEAEIAAIENRTRIICLAYELQGQELPIATEEAAEEAATEEPAETECVAESDE
ncbi:MAG: hypothetical protein IIV55_04140 [Alistipes sp.]|nr:hypothetical protein [Alistipes sp.]